jgi:hypothetical protein
MEVCEDIPQITIDQYNPATFMEVHAEKFQSYENLDKKSTEKQLKYYKKFDFFYRRTAFRSMNEFYKSQFKKVHDQWKEDEKTLIRSHITDEGASPIR